MIKKNAKSKRGDAERAGEWYAREALNCVVTRRAIRTKWQKVDFFAADIVGKKEDGCHVYLQVTAGQHSAVTVRRRKLEAIPWHPSDTVQLLQLIQTDDPANARRKLWFFRVHWLKGFECSGEFVWYTEVKAVPIPRAWFKAWKDE